MFFTEKMGSNKSGKKTDKEKNLKTVYIIILILFLLIDAVGIYILLRNKVVKSNAQDTYAQIAESVNSVTISEYINSEDSVSSDEAQIGSDNPTLQYYGAVIPEKSLDWELLHGINEDIYAWICVPGTLVDYPVVQHPSDNEYYLMHNLDGSYGYPACLYTENYNSKDFSDYNTVIYGHNMKDGTMFATLHYFETMDISSENQFFYIYTEDSVRVYLIVGAYQFPAKHLLEDYDMENIYVYEQYLKDMFRLSYEDTLGVSNMRADTELNMSDRIVTLSTCVNNQDHSYRYLVVGKYLTSEEY